MSSGPGLRVVNAFKEIDWRDGPSGRTPIINDGVDRTGGRPDAGQVTGPAPDVQRIDSGTSKAKVEKRVSGGDRRTTGRKGKPKALVSLDPGSDGNSILGG